MTVLKVVLDLPVDHCFEYLPPELEQAQLGAGDIGRRVLVPFGKRTLVGVIVDLAEDAESPVQKLKPAIKIFRDALVLDAHTLAVFDFCSSYYHHPLGEVVMNALPPGLRRVKPVFGKISERVQLTAAGYAVDPATLPTRATVKRRLVTALQTSGSLQRAEIARLSRRAPQLLSEMAKAGLITLENVPVTSRALPGEAAAAPPLTAEQAAVVEAVAAQLSHFSVTLLHGVTGSGKTEVYLRLVEQVIARGKQVLVLVPEINLTPQLESTFRSRFPSVPQVSLHSHLAEGERVNHYLAAQSGSARIILGTRLAVFTPLTALGLIIVDEEHDGSFKQQDGLRYSARDVAIYRARQLAIPVLLGSATPSLESYRNAQTARYHLQRLTARAVPQAALPAVSLIPLGKKSAEGLAEPVLDALRERLSRGEQSLVFINRRGYSPVLLCPQCGWLSGCSRCTAKLTLHANKRRLRCHHCGLEAAVPACCPDCGNAALRGVGQGTQRIEEQLVDAFSQARVLRVDRDTISGKSQLASFIDRVHGNEIDILVGTQMLAKGHDFPKLTLVVVINADASLYSSDFRAEEKLFAQLLQVAGRAGRAGIPGEVLVQTAFPAHPLFAALKRHDFTAFAEAQLRLRREVRFPPFSFQALLRVESVVDGAAGAFAKQAADLAKPLAKRVQVFDAVPAPLARVAGRWRWQLLVQSSSRGSLQPFLAQWGRKLADLPAGKVRWALDVDPAEL